jgi:glutathione peroxidase-family protein
MGADEEQCGLADQAETKGKVVLIVNTASAW